MCEYAEVFVTRDRVAKKNHKCLECDRPICIGQSYRYNSGIFDRTPFSHKICIQCAKLIDFLWKLPETECIDVNLYEYLDEAGYIDNCPHDKYLEKGRYCTISSSVPWLVRNGEYWELSEKWV